jgi:hypothetical protein
MRVIFLWIRDFEWKIFLDFRCYKFAKVLMLLELIMGDMGRSKRMRKQLSTSACTSCWILFTAKCTEFHLFLIIPLLRFSESSEVGKIADCIWSNKLPQVLELYRWVPPTFVNVLLSSGTFFLLLASYMENNATHFCCCAYLSY